MTEIEYRIADLINFSSNQKPIEFEDAFKTVLQNKVAAAIDARKVELAQSMFNPAVDDEQELEASDAETDEDLESEEDFDSEEAEEEVDA